MLLKLNKNAKGKNKDYFCGEEASKFLKFLIKEEGGFLVKKKMWIDIKE